MSQENVEIVRRAFEAFVSAGYEPATVEQFFELIDAEIQYDISRTNPETTIYHGHEGVSEALRQWVDTWEDYEAGALEFVDAGEDRVVTVIRERGKIKGSDAWVEHTRGAIWTVHNKRIIRYEEHQDRAQALTAAGLPE